MILEHINTGSFSRFVLELTLRIRTSFAFGANAIKVKLENQIWDGTFRAISRKFGIDGNNQLLVTSNQKSKYISCNLGFR
jgi:hypothetical protein